MTIASLTSSWRPSPRASNCLLTSSMRRALSVWLAPYALAAAWARVGKRAAGTRRGPRRGRAEAERHFDGVLREAAKHLRGGAKIPCATWTSAASGSVIAARHKETSHGRVEAEIGSSM